MERFRGKRSKVAAPTDRTASAMKEGNRQIRNQRNFPKSASDLSSCTSGSTEEDSFTIELGPNSSNQEIGTPMKKLLAKEMSKEAEPKKRSPSVIARLMGLDGLPPQQPIHKQQKKRTETIERAEVAGTCYGSQLHRKKNSKEQEEFKDVFEVLVAPKGESGRYQMEGQGTMNSQLTEAEKAFIQQKFMDAKRLSTDEKLQDSQEFHDALEVLDSNKDLLLKFLQEPDSLFTKHLLDLQGVPPQTHCRHMTVSKSLNSLKYESNAAGWKSNRGTSRKNDIHSPKKHHDDHFSHFYGKHDAHKSLQPSRIPFERRDKTSTLPTRIVVLKPNLGRVQSGSKSISSPRSSYDFLSDCGKHTGSMSVRDKESELQGFDGMGFSRHKSRESREIAKEITRKMRNSITDGSTKFSSAGFRGYAGDESSCRSGNESASELEETVLTSRNSFDRNSRRYRPSSSQSNESSVSREARKRLSERWKMTRRFQEGGAVYRGSTLAEMLAISDREVRSENLNSRIGQDGCSNSFSRNDGTSGWASPLGISSMDGWKDECVRHLPRSRSLPASSDVFGSPKTSMHHEAQGECSYMMSKEAKSRGRSRAIKRSIGPKEGLSRNLKCSSKKSHSSWNKSREHDDTLQEICFSHNEMKADLEEKDPSEEKPMISETSVCNSTDTNLIVDMIENEQENTAMSSESPDELPQELSTYIFVEKDYSTHDLDDSIPQEPSDGPLLGPVPEPESPSSSKEAGQPSPVSVLELAFPEDLSPGSECFERVSADLQGLRMQLQLLKLETDAYAAEGSILISSDEDAGVSEEKGTFRADDSWESSYIADVLVESGFNYTDPESFVAGWESSESPLSPMIFEKLEKVYGDPTTGLKSERKVVFDRINSVLLEVFQQFVDPQPWLKKGVHSWWREDRVEAEIYKLLARQEKKVNYGALDQEVERESEWLRLEADVNAIGMEIERMVMEELVTEIVSSL